jgi:hypothetical protein
MPHKETIVDYAKLRTLIETHPTHAATSDEDMAIWVNDPTAVTRDQTHLPNSEIQDIALSETAEWNALTQHEQATFGQIIAIRDSVPVETGTPTRDALQDILGTVTKAALGAALPEDVSRAVDDGITGDINKSTIAHARTF